MTRTKESEEEIWLANFDRYVSFTFERLGPDTGRTERRMNPFTREEMEIAVRPVATADVDASRNFVLRAGAVGPDEAERYAIDFNDGGRAVMAGDFGTGCELAIRTPPSLPFLTPNLAEFVFAFAAAGKWTMSAGAPSKTDPHPFIATSRDHVEPDASDHVIVCTTVGQMVETLRKEGWAHWFEKRPAKV